MGKEKESQKEGERDKDKCILFEERESVGKERMKEKDQRLVEI